MIWLSWRQFRTQGAVVFAAVAVFAALLAATGPRLARQYRTHGTAFLSQVSGADRDLYLFGALALLALPAIIGMFWGAPLVTRELEAGTHRLAWTQTTRTRWLAAKLGIVGLAAMAAAGLLSLALTWWAAPIDKAIAAGGASGDRPPPGILVFPRLSPEIFSARGIVPLGYAAFAFVLGVAIGLLIRRTLPAMALAFAAVVVVQVVMAVAVRPHLIGPEHLDRTITGTDIVRISPSGNLTVAIDRPGAWAVSQHTIDAYGRAVHPPSIDCPLDSGDKSRECFGRLARQGYRQRVSYHPAGRFWAFQRDETAIYLALALSLAGFCAWRIRGSLS